MRAEFSVRLGKLPSQLVEEATSIVAAFSTPIIYRDNLIGSGTFVRIEDRWGILTANHVASLVEFSPNSDHTLRLCLVDFPHDFQIPVAYLRHHEIAKPQCEEFGPDLSFVEILAATDRTKVEVYKSFYSCTVRAIEKLREANRAHGFWLLAGCPDELVHADTPTADFSEVFTVPGIGGCSGVEARHECFGFDYLDVGVDYGGQSQPVNSFGGCSGGGLWRFELTTDANDSDGSITIESFYLSGVAFYQTAIVNHHRIVRAHGPTSLYQKAVALLKV